MTVTADALQIPPGQGYVRIGDVVRIQFNLVMNDLAWFDQSFCKTHFTQIALALGVSCPCALPCFTGIE